jgi:hypothetical protein
MDGAIDFFGERLGSDSGKLHGVAKCGTLSEATRALYT